MNVGQFGVLKLVSPVEFEVVVPFRVENLGGPRPLIEILVPFRGSLLGKFPFN